jgi:hypothetical protein
VRLTGKLDVSLRFEQQRFYNPHHHPEMPRTLQLPGRTVGLGKDYSRMHYDQAVLCLQVQVTPEASVTHLKEKIY